MSLNRCQIIGNLGKDAELRYTASALAKCEFGVAVTTRVKNGDRWEDGATEWFNVVVWRDLAERTAAWATKGTKVFVEGHISTRSWDGNDGVKHYRTELMAEKIERIARAEGAAPPGRKAQPDDDLPWE